MSIRVRTDIEPLISRTFQDLLKPNSRVFQDPGPKNCVLRTSQDTFRSRTFTHQINYWCNCITKKNYSGVRFSCILEAPDSVSWCYVNKPEIQNSNSALVFQDFPGFSRTFQAWNSEQQNSRTFQGLYEPWSTGYVVMLCGWEGKRRHRAGSALQTLWYIQVEAQWPKKRDGNRV